MDLLDCRANLRFFGAQLRTSLRAAVALRGAFLIELTFMALNNLIFFTFWWALFLRVPNIRGFDLADVAVLFGLVAVSYGLHVVLAGGASELGRMIVDGELDTYLTRPKPALVAVLGSRSRASGMGDIASGLVLIVGFGRLSWSSLPWSVLAVAVSTVILTATVTSFFCLAFYLGQVRALVQLAFEMLLNFSLYPKVLFGGLIKGLMFTVIPAAYVGHLPASLVRTPSVLSALLLVLIACVYWFGACLLFRRGLERYNSGSRCGLVG